MKRGKAIITRSLRKDGFALTLKSIKRNIRTKLSYPEKIWRSYSKKEKLTRNLTYLSTLPFPLVARFREVEYNTAEPELKNRFKELMLKDLPLSTLEYKQDYEKIKRQFLSTRISFSGKIKEEKDRLVRKNLDSSKAVVPLSMGRDSLLSLSISKEVGLSPTAVYINDTISPTENKLKLEFIKSLSKELNLKGIVVTNSIEKLNDFETWRRREMSLNYAHMVTSFCLISLPIAEFYGSKYIIPGNEKNMDFSGIVKGKKVFASYDQTTEWTKEQDKMVKEFSNAAVFSIIRPITDMAALKILHTRYPEAAKYQHSCNGLDASLKRRWCLDCDACIGISLFLSAFGINPKVVGLKKLFKKKNRRLFSLFGGKPEVLYDNLFSEEQELLAFLMASRQGQKGYLINSFKKRYMKEALAREDELRKKYFKIYSSRIPAKIKTKVLSIYKEELKDLY
jgi:hypothetical protein